jgi:hypothetical protein
MVPSPAEIEERLVSEHWEGDTIKGKYNCSAVGTLVERSTLFTVLAKMNGTGAEPAVDGFTRVLDRVEAQKRLSITYDCGKEMALHETLSVNTGVRSTSPTRTLPSSAASTKTQTDSSASSCQKPRTSAFTLGKNSTSTLGCSTQDRESRWDGSAPLNFSSQTSTS